jgi:hypothetical protein
MTELRAAQIEIVCEPRLTLSTLLDLRHLVTLYLSSLGSVDSEGSHDAEARSKTGATIRGQQFRPRTATSEGGIIAQQATHELMQWMRVLAKAMGAGVSDEQNKR